MSRKDLFVDYWTGKTSEPTKRHKLQEVILSLHQLKDGWDGHDGVSPCWYAIADAKSLLNKFDDKILPDHIAPCSDGEVCLFWDFEEDVALFADFGVYGDGTYSYYMYIKDNLDNKQEFSGDSIPLTQDLDQTVQEVLWSFYA